MIRPLGDRILLRKLESPAEEGGIVIPDEAREKKQEAVVIAMAPPPDLVEQWALKSGDHVIISKYAGTNISFKGVDYTLVNRKDILCFVPAEDHDGVDVPW